MVLAMSLSKTELEKAKFCAELCHAVYDPDLHQNPKRILNVVSGIDTDKQFKYFGNAGIDTQAFVLKKDDTVFVVFKGTEKTWDWIVNLYLKFTNDMKVGSYHSGFMLASRLSFDEVGTHFISVLKAYPNSKVVLTGHSLGGAMATMYAYILKKDHPSIEIESVVTFGQPRCGNFKFTDYLNSLKLDYKRFVNKGDYIADVPIPFRRGLWSHSGTGFVLSDSAMLLESVNYESTISFHYLTPLIAIYQLLKSKNFKVKEIKKEERKKISSNHEMPLYIKRIEEEIARK